MLLALVEGVGVYGRPDYRCDRITLSFLTDNIIQRASDLSILFNK